MGSLLQGQMTARGSGKVAEFALRFLGVGNANALSLGSSAAVLERDGVPLLLIDCGPDTLHSYLARYGQLPPALFITHAYLDHVAGLEGSIARLIAVLGNSRGRQTLAYA